jgi:hypothetical protein
MRDGETNRIHLIYGHGVMSGPVDAHPPVRCDTVSVLFRLLGIWSSPYDPRIKHTIFHPVFELTWTFENIL